MKKTLLYDSAITKHVADNTIIIILFIYEYVSVYIYICVCVCVRVRVCAYVI